MGVGKAGVGGVLPVETEFLKKAGVAQLIYQGFYLHFASLWGPLRSSKRYRLQNKNWFVQSLFRWFQEYGYNLLLFLVGQIIIFTSFFSVYFVATLVSLLMLPLLTVLQMFIDNFRTDSQVYFNPDTGAGLTVKTHVAVNGPTVWTYFNHFALPIGNKNGTSIREQLHLQAAANHHILSCHAQNMVIAKYYLGEKPEGSANNERRPQLVWNYSGKVWVEREVNKFSQMFGIHSTRNSGQIPLKKFNSFAF